MSSWDEIEAKIIEALAKMAAQGSVPAANAALKQIAEARDAETGRRHSEIVAELAGDNEALAEYYGTLGLSDAATAEQLGIKVSASARLAPELVAARARGEAAMKVEIRALQLARVRSGSGKIERWMS